MLGQKLGTTDSYRPVADNIIGEPWTSPLADNNDSDNNNQIMGLPLSLLAIYCLSIIIYRVRQIQAAPQHSKPLLSCQA